MAPAEDQQLWEVIGGATTGGILVRVGRSLESTEASERLQCGSVIKQTDLKGERLCYELVSGKGPSTGWVSLKLKGKELLVKREPRPKLLLLSIPWKGHIVHLRRLAEWFADKGLCEVHFATLPSTASMVPKGCVAHMAKGDEVQADELFDVMEGDLRGMAQQDQSVADGASNLMGMFIKTGARYSSEGREPYAQYFKFCLRVIKETQPKVVVGDAAGTFFNLVAGFCQSKGIKNVWVQSPGLREMNLEANAQDIGDGMNQKTGAISSLLKSLGGIEIETLAKAMGVPVETLKGIDQGINKPPPPGTKLSFLGLLQSIQVTPDLMPFLCKPLGELLGMDHMRMMETMAASFKVEDPLWLLPSSRTLVGQEARPGDLYTGGFLPLPPRGSGQLRWDRKTFEASSSACDSELLEWLFSADCQDPIIYMAFGTIVQPSAELLKLLVEALDKGPWRVLWSLTENMQALLPKDLDGSRWRVMKFVPQAEVLKCERVKVFISHMGANSTTESLACGVPIACCPFYLDQFEWTEVVCKHWKAGQQVDRSSAEAFRNSVKTVMEEPCFAAAAAAASDAMFQSSKETEDGLKKLGDNLSTPSSLGVGVSVAAAALLRLISNESTEPVFKLVDEVCQKTGKR
mmetsp:Transcript_43385/g.92912  ORF Transcript_43385/g.92912 Transcript_43385/m.92912 type:complete len:632 (+) Transcript_43385:51-1946(+)